MSQLNTIVIHVRAEQAEEFERRWAEEELPRWKQFHTEGKFISARFYRSEFGTDERPEVAKYVIAVEVPDMAAHAAHDADPGFQEWDRQADRYQPEAPLVYGGDILHSVG